MGCSFDVRIAWLLAVVSGPIFCVADSNLAIPSSLPQKVFDVAKQVAKLPVVSFNATHTLEEFPKDSTSPRAEDGYKRSIAGTLSSQGLFRFEIEYVEGAASGQKYIVSFDGKRTYIVNSFGKSNYLVTKKGRMPSISFLFYAVSIAEPFAFLFPQLFSPSDQGSYITLADLDNQTLWANWFAESTLKPTADGASVIVERTLVDTDGQKLSVTVLFNAKTFLATRITVKSVTDNRVIEEREIVWQEVSAQGSGPVLLPRKVVIEQYEATGARAVLTTEIESIQFPKDLPNAFWPYDISRATTIFDGDENLMIPSSSK
jgi:hypothetical protein